MATIIEYNGVTFYNVMTRKWDEEIIYDSTGTDEIGKKYSLTFDCVLHQQRTPLNASQVFVSSGDSSLDNSPTSNVFLLMRRVTNLLNHPRKPLRIYFGTFAVNQLALEILPASGELLPSNVDIDNGPRPKVVSITPIGTKAFKITFSVEGTISTCADKVRSGDSVVISNRWSISETMDQNHFTTRRISGELKLAAGLLAAGTDGGGNEIIRGFPGHAYKHLTIPRLELGFKRDGLMFSSSADGLTCTYEIVDRQVHHSAPWPATSLESTHSESSQQGAFFTSEAHVRLVGDPSCDKTLLVERVVQVLEARLGLTGVPNNDKALYIDNFTITDHIGESAIVEGHARVNRTVEATTGPLANFFFGKLGQKLELDDIGSRSSAVDNTPYDSNLSREPAIYGYSAGEEDKERRPAVLFFLHCYLQTPCDDVRTIGPGVPVETTTPTDYDREREETATVYEAPAGSLNYSPTGETFSEATKAAMYTTAQVSSRFISSTMTVALPIANMNPARQNDPRSREGQRDLLMQAVQGNQRQPTARILQLAGPQSRWVFRVNLERIGQQPDVPQPVTYRTFGDVNATLKDFDVEVLAPIRSPDGSQQVHRVLATYVYLLDRPPLLNEPVPVGVNPITNFPDYDGSLKLSFNGNIGIPTSPTTGPQSG